MQFTSTIIVALLAVSTCTVSAAPKFSNLRGGGGDDDGSHKLQEERVLSDPSAPSRVSAILEDTGTPSPFRDSERSLVDAVVNSTWPWDWCPGADQEVDCKVYPGFGIAPCPCPSGQVYCSAPSHDYCHVK